MAILICVGLLAAVFLLNSVKKDTGNLKTAMDKAVARLPLARLSNNQTDEDTLRREIFAKLESEHKLPSGSLASNLPAYARKLAADTSLPKLERACAAYALKNYTGAEHFALEAVSEAKKADPLRACLKKRS